MIHQYESPSHRRLVFSPLGRASLTLPVAPDLLALITRLADDQPAEVLEALQQALGQAGEMLEALRATQAPPITVTGEEKAC